jgi:hypothetical protein
MRRWRFSAESIKRALIKSEPPAAQGKAAMTERCERSAM